MSDERDELARELFIADNFNQPREQSIVDWQWFMETPRFAVRIERYKAMAEGVIAAGFGSQHDAWAEGRKSALNKLSNDSANPYPAS